MKQIIIKNRFLPVRGFKAINILGVIFVRREFEATDVLVNHERIHSKQIREVMFLAIFPLLIPVLTFNLPWLLLLWPASFYIWYGVEFLVHYIRMRNLGYSKKVRFRLSRRRISFEREAYLHEYNLQYLSQEKNFEFLKLLKK